MKLGSVASLVVPVAGADPILGRVDRAAELGIAVLNVSFREPGQREPGYMESVAEAASKKGVELRLLGTGGRFGSPNPDERKADAERVVADLLDVKRHTGIGFSSIVNRPMDHNRWSPEPPMDERIDIIAESLAKVADAVASAGIVLGLENHCDYRGHECAAMLEKANRPNLGAQLDTGNAFTVFEDPMDCARALARWTLSVHLKDVRVTPLAPAPWSGARTETVPLGEGHVDNVAICGMIQEQAPDPRSVALMIEPLAMPAEADRDAFLQACLAWARARLAPFLA